VDDLYLLVRVTDDRSRDQGRAHRLQAPLADPTRSRSRSTRAAPPRTRRRRFKTGIFPTTTAGTACFERDADNHQGDAGTAPGMQVASVVSSPYAGYTLEVKIPLADLPSAVDPAHLGLNVFIYDSDTQDLTGQTRLGWSTYGGVQGDPYRWGHATLPGYTPPAGRPTTPADPTIEQTAALSIDSPQSILQSATDGGPARRRHGRGGGRRREARPAADADRSRPDARTEGGQRRQGARVRVDGNEERRRRRGHAREGQEDDP